MLYPLICELKARICILILRSIINECFFSICLLFFCIQLDQLKIEVAGVKDKAKKDDILAKIRNYRDKISQSKQKAMFGGSKPMSGAEISQVCTQFIAVCIRFVIAIVVCCDGVCCIQHFGL